MQKQSSIWLATIRNGLIGGAVSLLLCLVGMVTQFGERYIISGVITMGQILVIAPVLIFGYRIARRLELPRSKASWRRSLRPCQRRHPGRCWSRSGQVINLRAMFVNASPELYEVLTLGLGVGAGIPALLAVAALVGAARRGPSAPAAAPPRCRDSGRHLASSWLACCVI